MLTNGVWMQTTSTGTGNLTLTTYNTFVTFAAAYPVDGTTNKSQNFYYSILDNNSPPNPMEWGIGYLSASTTLVRQKVLGTWSSSTLSTNSPSALNLAAGTYNIVNALAMGGAWPSLTGVNSTIGSSSGAYTPPPMGAPTTASTVALTSNQMTYFPFCLNYARQINSISFRVSVGVSGNGRLGIYTCDETGSPGNKLIESGDLSIGSSGTVVTYSLGTPFILPPDWYYFAFANKGDTATLNTFNAFTNFHSPVGNDSTRVQAIIGYTQTLTGGWTSLPDPGAPTASSSTPGNFPIFSFK